MNAIRFDSRREGGRFGTDSVGCLIFHRDYSGDDESFWSHELNKVSLVRFRWVVLRRVLTRVLVAFFLSSTLPLVVGPSILQKARSNYYVFFLFTSSASRAWSPDASPT